MNRLTVSALFFMSFPALSNTELLTLGHTCSYFGEEIPHSVYTFASDAEAESIVDSIMEKAGLPKNFQIVAAGVPNAAAVIRGTKRYILYNQTFISDLRTKVPNKWAAHSIMAHEIGHHLAGHTLDDLGSRPALELEADKYSGFMLNKLGASLKDAQVVIDLLGSTKGSATHPAKHNRLAAIANGWIESCDGEACDRTAERPSVSSIGTLESDYKLTSYVVSRVQKSLSILGYDVGPIDGMIGKKTYAAIRKWQAQSKNNIRGGPLTKAQISDIFDQAISADRNNSKVATKQSTAQQKERFVESRDKKLYYGAIRQRIERKWRQPKGLGGNVVCTITVLQLPSGEINDVDVTSCNPNNKALKMSVQNAVWAASPLPAAPKPNLYKRQLKLKFNPRQ